MFAYEFADFARFCITHGRIVDCYANDIYIGATRAMHLLALRHFFVAIAAARAPNTDYSPFRFLHVLAQGVLFAIDAIEHRADAGRPCLAEPKTQSKTNRRLKIRIATRHKAVSDN